jgi:hypothetical protein
MWTPGEESQKQKVAAASETKRKAEAAKVATDKFFGGDD